MVGALKKRDCRGAIREYHRLPILPAACAQGLLPCRRLSMDGAEELGSLLDDKLLLKDLIK